MGNTVGPCEEYSITLNVVPPAPPVIERVEDNVGNPNNAVVALQKDDVTNDNTPTIIGTAVANGIVIIFNNDVAIGSTKVSADNKWSFTPSPVVIPRMTAHQPLPVRQRPTVPSPSITVIPLWAKPRSTAVVTGHLPQVPHWPMAIMNLSSK
ncbi:Ig-like domain-containing protein [Limnobaculum zhutongyuii]|uniref:Ig-like domain-containing protein n=1 Tax=Limnobaculum zhutongyuii TaxID=2498113 RepID=UPI0021B125E3|nr:Ig-like domain-containing protein [Limnobaculum zhutongyuii]